MIATNAEVQAQSPPFRHCVPEPPTPHMASDRTISLLPGIPVFITQHAMLRVAAPHWAMDAVIKMSPVCATRSLLTWQESGIMMTTSPDEVRAPVAPAQHFGNKRTPTAPSQQDNPHRSACTPMKLLLWLTHQPHRRVCVQPLWLILFRFP